MMTNSKINKKIKGEIKKNKKNKDQILKKKRLKDCCEMLQGQARKPNKTREKKG
jgi:hypothetical protein